MHSFYLGPFVSRQRLTSSTARGFGLLALVLAGCGPAALESMDALVPLQKDHGLPALEDAGVAPVDSSMDTDASGPGADGGPCGERSAGAGTASSCGVIEMLACSECRGVDECGAGMSNFVPIINCDNCPARVDSHVCEAGRCRPLGAPGALRVRFSISAAATGARSFIAIALNSVAANGDKLRCAELQSSCMLTSNPQLNATNVAFQLFSGPADPSLIYVTTFGGEAGEERIVMLIVTSEASGGGDIMGIGCLEGVSVGTNTPTEVAIEVK